MKNNVNKRKVNNKKRKISKRRRKQIMKARLILVTTVLILSIIVVKFKNIVFSEKDSPKVVLDNNKVQQNKVEDNSISKLNKILKSPETYPESLIELAKDNEETIDFVYDYPKNKDKDYKINPNDFDKNKDEIQSFIQWDERWGYKTYGDDFMALTGCAPTSLAMVISSLNNDKSVTPYVIAKYAEENNFYVDEIGSSWTLVDAATKKYGLKSKGLPNSENNIINTLRNGNPIIASVGPGTFTQSGHFLVLTGVTKDGKIKINDPNSIINSKKEWDIDVFLRESEMLWEIIK